MKNTSLLLLAIVACAAAIPTSVMLSLDTVNNQGQLSDPAKLRLQFKNLKSGGVRGIMIDVWWGLVEQQPKTYVWTPYRQLFEMARDVGLNAQPVMSFHRCGGNVGDTCDIPLPKWVRDIGQQNKNIWYQDQHHNIDDEYLSCGIDNLPLLQGRTAVQVYTDFMTDFATVMADLMPSTIDEIQVGLGPAGEMRYPSYQLSKWTYCGIGGFQSYDAYLMTELASAAKSANHTEWGMSGGPNNAGDYNSRPSGTGFFSSGTDNVHSAYGMFYGNWYAQRMIQHGREILTAASSIFAPKKVGIAAKVSGIHWWYGSDHHAAEMTAGYYNTNSVDAYYEIAKMLKEVGGTFDFTCLEMFDQVGAGCQSRAEQLVVQTRKAAVQAGIPYSGENALQMCTSGGCDQYGFNQIVKQSTFLGNIKQFTFLRLTDDMFTNQNIWNSFKGFVATMASKN